MFDPNSITSLDRMGNLGVGLLVGLGFLTVLVSVVLFSLKHRAKSLSAALYVAGFVLIWFGLFLAQWQKIEHKKPSGIRGFPDVITFTPRHDEVSRALMAGGLIMLPLIAGRGYYAGVIEDRRRRAAALPVHMKSGLDHFHHRDYDAAIADYSKALKLDPKYARAFDRRGNAYLSKGDLEHALTDFNQAIAIDPILADAYMHRGMVHAARGFHDLAVIDFNSALNIQPNAPDGYLNRGICRVQQGDLQGATADFRAILHLTNHTDYTEPARVYLQQLGAVV